MNLVSSTYFLLSLGIGLLLSKILPIPKWLKLLVGPALGIITITEMTLVVSLLFKYSVNSILTSLILVLVATIFLKKIIHWIPDKEKFSWQTHWPLLISLSTIGIYVVFIFSTQVLAPKDSGLVTGNGGLYADTALHSAYTMSIVTQGVPPKNPLFAPQSLIYPYLVNLYSANLVMLGSNLRFAFILPQLTYFLAFFCLFYFVSRQFTPNKGTFLAMLFFFLGWGLGFTNFIKESRLSGVWNITHEYTNDMKDYQLHNPLTGLIFPERSFLPGLVIGLLITALFLRYQKTKQNHLLSVIGVLIGILPLWHTHTFLFFGISVGIWLLNNLFSSQKREPLIFLKAFSQIYIPVFILASPVIWWFGHQVAHSSFIHLSLGWINGQNQILFWLENGGFILPLALAGFFIVKKQIRLFFIAPFILFFVANLIIFQPWDWDNIKLFTWVFLFLTILVGHTLTLFTKKGYFAKLLVLFILIVSTFSGILSLISQTKQTFSIYDKNDIDMANWVKKNTAPTDVFLIDPWPNHPIPGLTGRSVYLGYPGHLWVHGINYYKREQDTKAILGGSKTNLAGLDTQINYIAVTATEKSTLAIHGITPVYTNTKFTILKVNQSE